MHRFPGHCRRWCVVHVCVRSMVGVYVCGEGGESLGVRWEKESEKEESEIEIGIDRGEHIV